MSYPPSAYAILVDMSNRRGRKFRSLPADDKLAIRTFVVLQHKQGEPAESLASKFNLDLRTVVSWIAGYAFGSLSDLKDKPRSGRPRKLTAKQAQWVAETIREKDPLQMKFGFVFWTLRIVRQLILDKFGISIGNTTVWRALKRLGLTCQRPKIRCYQQDADAVKNWKEQDYPKLVARAKEFNALIVFADEAGMRSDYHVGTTWGERGKTPIAKFTGKRFRLNMLAAISPEGPIYYRLHEGTATARTFCEFLQHIADATGDRPVYVVVDQVSIHKATEVAEWLAGREGKEIELHYLPTYSPELNPAELVWSLVKGTVGKEFVKTKSDLKDRLLAAFEALKGAPKKVQQFFREPDCLYTVS